MPGTISIGRIGFRGLEAIKDELADVNVVCTKLTNPVLIRSGNGKVVRKHRMSLEEVKAELLYYQHDATMALVQKVVDAILDGKRVCVMCMQGRNRSQAIASIACDVLEKEHAAVEFWGPLCLRSMMASRGPFSPVK